MKKFVIFILLVTVSFSFITCVNATTGNSPKEDPVIMDKGSQKAVDILNSCGISIHFNESGFITNGDFAITILEMLNVYNGESGQMAIDTLRSVGIIPSDMRFFSNTTTSIDDAYKICVNALGYAGQSKFSGYLKIVSNVGLKDGIKTTDRVDNENFALLMLNMFRAPVNEIVSIGNDYVRYKEGEPLHWVYHDIICVKDILYASEDAAVNGYESAIKDNCVFIGNVEISTYDNDISEFLGCKIEAYARQNDNKEYDMLSYFVFDDNKILDIEAADISCAKGFESGDSFLERKNPKIQYSLKNSVKEAKLAANSTILYNGNYTSEINNNDFIGKFGKVRMVDYNKDGLFDILYVKKYVVYTISGIDRDNMILTFKDGQKIEIENINKLVVKDNKEIVDFSALEKDMIVGLYRTKGAEKDSKIEISIFSKQVTGVVSKIQTQKNMVTVDGVEYEYNKSAVNDIKLNCTYKFILDNDDIIIYSEVTADSSYYAYFEAYEINTKNIEEQILFKVLESDNKPHIYTLNKTIRYTGLDKNGNWTDRQGIKTEDIKAILSLRFQERTLIKISEKDEKITEIVMPKDMSKEIDYQGWTDDEFTLEEEYGKVQNRLLLAAKSVSRNYKKEYVNTLVVLDDTSENEISMFQYKGNRANEISLAAYGLKKTSIYDSNDALVASICVVKFDPNLVGDGIGANFEIPNENNRQRFIVEDINQTLNDEGELTYSVTGYINNKLVTYTAVDADVTQKYKTEYADKGCYTVGELRKYDVIFVDLDEKGKLVDFYFLSRP